MDLARAANIGLGLLFAAAIVGCGDDGGVGGSDTDSGSGTETPDTTTSSTTNSTTSLSASSDPTTTGEESTSSSSSESSSTGEGCSLVFEPLEDDQLPRCEAETRDCWISCPGVDPHECTAACTAADPMPAVDIDGTPVDCGRCVNSMFATCWHETCPAEVEASRCCALASGCDPECLAFGPCGEDDLECIRQSCGPELAAQSACLMESGALQTCRIEMNGLPDQCFDGGGGTDDTSGGSATATTAMTN